MKARSWFLSLALFSAASFAGQVEQSVEAVVSQYVTAIHDFDQVSLEKLFAPDYIEISPVGEVDERNKTIGFYDANAKQLATGKSPQFAVSEPITRVYGDMAITVAKLAFEMTAPDGSKVERAMRAVFVMHKNQGQWQIVSTQFTGIRAPNK